MRAAVSNAVMTASQRLEMALTKRPPSDVPVRVVEQSIGRPVVPGARVAVGYLAQGGLAAVALVLACLTRRVPAVHAAAMTAIALVAGDAAVAMAAGVGDAPWRWSRKDLATDALHKSVLAATATRLARHV
jgi:hypothetical protein